MDAVITARFRRQGMCTRIEGERMLAFSNTANLLTLISVKTPAATHRAAGVLRMCGGTLIIKCIAPWVLPED